MMIQYLITLLLCLCLNFTTSGATLLTLEDSMVGEAVLPTYKAEKKQQDRDTLRDTDIQDHHQSNAVISDSQDIYRICNSRPQRLLSTTGIKPAKQLGRMLFLTKFKNLLNISYGSVWRGSFRCILPHVSCRYFVIALRHILR